jgi:hypothetical protein
MLNISQLWRWFLGDREPVMSRSDLEDLDVSVEFPLTMYDQEKFVVQDGELAGTTGIIKDDEISHTSGKSLDGLFGPYSESTNNIRVTPDFDNEKTSILEASKATSLLLVESTDSKGRHAWDFATAFFVTPTLLLTAGHAAIDSPEAVKTERYLFLPGTLCLNIDEISARKPYAVRCNVVETLFKANAHVSKDIAILSSGSFESQSYLELSADPVPVDATIDIIGYPGEKRTNWLREKHPELKSLVEGASAGEALLPTRQLVVTRGVVKRPDYMDMTSYNISTCPGFSGSCLIYQGKVHGIPMLDT